MKKNKFKFIIYIVLGKVIYELANNLSSNFNSIPYIQYIMMAILSLGILSSIFRRKLLLPTFIMFLSYSFIHDNAYISQLIRNYNFNKFSLYINLSIALINTVLSVMFLNILYRFCAKKISSIVNKIMYLLPGGRKKRLWNLANLDLETVDNLCIDMKPSEKLKFSNPKKYSKAMGHYVKEKGYLFEDLVADMYNSMGYNAKTTTQLRNEKNLPESILKRGGAGEQGVDVIVEMKDSNKHSFLLLIQCKHYSANVGNTAVQEINAAEKIYSNHFNKPVKLAVLSNQNFSGPAQDLAESLDVELFGRKEFLNMLMQVQGKLTALAA